MGHAMPQAHAAMRDVKAEGGWAVVCTEECEIHPIGDISPYVEVRLWDDHDIPALALMARRCTRTARSRRSSSRTTARRVEPLFSREVAAGAVASPLQSAIRCRRARWTRRDIRDYRRWHRDAALRAQGAGFDIVYVYAAHDFSLPCTSCRGGAIIAATNMAVVLENRVRLLREVIEDTKDAVGDSCAVAVRFAIDELLGADGLARRRGARRSSRCWPNCPTSGTSTSAPGATTR